MAGNGNEFLPNYVEHIVPLKENKLLLPKKLGLIAFAIVMVLVSLYMIFIAKPIFAGLGAVVLILISFVIWYLWRFVSIEYEYAIHQGEMVFDVVYGRRQRKHYYTAVLKNVEKIAKLQNGDVPEADRRDVAKEVFCASKKNGPYVYYALVREADGTKTLLFFEATEKGEKVLRFYNARAFFGA